MNEKRQVRAKTETEKRVLELIEPVCEELGLRAVRVRMMGRETRKILQIMAERPSDQMLGIKDCAGLSRAISALIDVDDPVAGKYDLEVSSPGIDRPLTLPEHFSRWAGHEVKIELNRLVEGRRRFRGLLGGLEEENLLIDLEGEEETAYMPLAWVSDVRLVMSDALMKESASRNKSPELNDQGETSHER